MSFNNSDILSLIREKKLISPLPRGGRRISSSAFLSRCPFGNYLPIVSYGTIFAAKWSSNGGLEAHRCFLFCFSPPNALFLVGAFVNKRARLLQSLVYFIQDRLEATNVKINVQLLNTVLNYWTGKGNRGAHLG